MYGLIVIINEIILSDWIVLSIFFWWQTICHHFGQWIMLCCWLMYIQRSRLNENCRHYSVTCERCDKANSLTRQSVSFFGTAGLAVKLPINNDTNLFEFHEHNLCVTTVLLVYFKARKILLICCRRKPRVPIEVYVIKQYVVC